MRKYVLGLILLLMVTPRILVSLGIRPRVEKVVKFEEVVQLFTEFGSCTGFIAAKNTVVTAAHCVDDSPQKRVVVFLDGVVGSYEILTYGTQTPGYDYAILKTETGARPFFKFSQSYPRVMEGAALIGHSEGEANQYLVLGMYLRTDGWQVFGMLAYPGDSGSPIINSDQEVIAVLYGGFNPIPTTVGTPISVVAEQMARLGIRQ